MHVHVHTGAQLSAGLETGTEEFRKSEICLWTSVYACFSHGFVSLRSLCTSKHEMMPPRFEFCQSSQRAVIAVMSSSLPVSIHAGLVAGQLLDDIWAQLKQDAGAEGRPAILMDEIEMEHWKR